MVENLSSLRWMLVFPLLFLGAAGAAPAAELRLGNGSAATATLALGDDLWVGLAGASPGPLTDSCSPARPAKKLPGARPPPTTPAGVADLLLWAATGVVGCGVRRRPQPYVFASLAAAAAALDGQELRIEVLGADGVLAGEAVLPVAAAAELVYFSDADGCPRSCYQPREQAWLGFVNADRARPDRIFYLVAGPPGEEPEDLRGAPEPLKLPEADADWLLPIDLAEIGEGGPFGGYLGFVLPPAGGPRIIEVEYQQFGDYAESGGGILITSDGCPPRPKCPVPPALSVP